MNKSAYLISMLKNKTPFEGERLKNSRAVINSKAAMSWVDRQPTKSGVGCDGQANK